MNHSKILFQGPSRKKEKGERVIERVQSKEVLTRDGITRSTTKNRRKSSPIDIVIDLETVPEMDIYFSNPNVGL